MESPQVEKEQTLLYKVITNLTFWVLLAIVAGILLGHYAPDTAKQTKIIGDYFVKVIKIFVVPIIFLTIVLGISGMGDLRKVGRIGIKALLYFEIVTTFALGIGVLAAYAIAPGKIDRANIPIRSGTVSQKEFSWLQFFMDNITLQVLVVAIIAGVALNYSRHRETVNGYLYKCSSIVFKALKWFMYLAPIGAFAGMAYTIGEYGLETLMPLGKLMLTVYITMAIFIFLILGSIMRYYKMNILAFITYIKAELLLVLGTSSSESALPNLMEKLERMGCSKSVVGLVVPTGYSFNLDGTSIYLSMAVIFLAQLYDVHLTWGEMITIIGLLMITSKGAAGVTGSGFVVLASTLTAMDKIPLEGLPFLFGVDKFMSEARALTNFIGNGVATIVISKSEREFVAIDNPRTEAE